MSHQTTAQKPNIIHLIAPDHINQVTIDPDKLNSYRQSRTPLTLILEFNPNYNNSLDIQLLTNILILPCITQFIFITNNPLLSLALEYLKQIHNETWIIVIRHEDLLYTHLLQVQQ